MDASGISPATLLIVPLAVPFFAGFLSYAAGEFRPRLRSLIAILATGACFIIIGLFIPSAIPDLTSQIAVSWPYFFYTPVLQLNPLSYTIILVTIFVWMLATIYCESYLKNEERTNRFTFFWLFTLFALLGVLFSGDFITLYVFFELLTLSAYVLINHYQTRESMLAARKYLFLSLAGSFLILAGIAVLYGTLGTAAIAPVYGLPEHLVYIIAGCMFLGFGVKAGMYPVHIWLPDAHSVAPTPASAILSGLIIKIGAYGIILTTFFILFPSYHADAIEAITTIGGKIVIWIGLITMLFAVFLALMQSSSKRMLAYHSISQMGFIILGVGCALLLGEGGGTGFAGGLFHLVNHALFKALLFLSVGTVLLMTGEGNMYRLGGLVRSMPVACVAMAVGVFAISGIPGFNGFVSKAFIHHALLDAQQIGGLLLLPAEAIFIITCGGTVASTGKLLIYTFFGEKKGTISLPGTTPFLMKAAMVGIAIAIILLGILPGLALFFILPAAAMIPFQPDDLAYLAEYLGYGGAAIYTPYTVSIAGLEVLCGVVIFIAYVFFGWFHWEKKRIIAPISPDAWYERSTRAILRVSTFFGRDLFNQLQKATETADTFIQNKQTSIFEKYRDKIRYLSTFEGSILLITIILGMYLVIFLLMPGT